ncbi:TonB C-terminal domain-containing protein [Methyloversatilis thermotolerans]|uniref:TonB C-terminal domain-containing protein n=1 Tax=Methyloversatilis thermotolerans TaxID=1346290 RepID=UPI000371215E|nr:TonB C-terminal domain-containing protein [Methyloversatilis thermotolerans]
MAALAEDSVDLPRSARALRVVALVLGLALVVAAGMWLKDMLSKPPGPTRQVTRISIIPDTPPPPPPPPKEEKRPEPPKDQKEVKVEQPKPVEAPPQQAEQLKMEGAAGDGPSPFASGTVTNDYKGGEVGTTIGGGPARVNPAAFRFYTNALLAHVQRQLAQNRDVKQLDYAVAVKVWVGRDGRIERAELVDSTGEQNTDAALTRALSQLTAFQDPPPAGMPQPVRLLVKNRITG